MDMLLKICTLVFSLTGIVLSLVNLLRRKKTNPTWSRAKGIRGIVDKGQLLPYKPIYAIYVAATLLFVFSLLIILSISITCLCGGMEWDNSVTIGVATLFGITGLLFGVVLYIYLIIRRQYKQVEMDLTDAEEVLADIKSIGSVFPQQPELMQYEITLHLRDGDIVKVTSADKSACEGNLFLKKFDGKTVDCSYSKSHDKIMVA